MLKEGIITVRQLQRLNGKVSRFSLSDTSIMNLAEKLGYTVVTNDRMFVIRSLIKGIDIIFQNDLREWYYLSGKLTKKLNNPVLPLLL